MLPFAEPDYLVVPHGDGPGLDTGLVAARDGSPRTVPVIRVEPFTLPGVGRRCYVTDPAGLLIGLHEYDLDAL